MAIWTFVLTFVPTIQDIYLSRPTWKSLRKALISTSWLLVTRVWTSHLTPFVATWVIITSDLGIHNTSDWVLKKSHGMVLHQLINSKWLVTTVRIFRDGDIPSSSIYSTWPYIPPVFEIHNNPLTIYTPGATLLRVFSRLFVSSSR